MFFSKQGKVRTQLRIAYVIKKTPPYRTDKVSAKWGSYIGFRVFIFESLFVLLDNKKVVYEK